jgi:hypothetical protein
VRLVSVANDDLHVGLAAYVRVCCRRDEPTTDKLQLARWAAGTASDACAEALDA